MKILIIDDDVSITNMLKMLLETRGYTVNVAANGQEAFQLVDSNTDLILLDIILPDQDGFDLCRKLKENESTNTIPIIIISARFLSEDIVEGLYLGADDYMTKPFEYEELIARAEAVVRRSSIFRNNKDSNRSDEAIIQELRLIIDEKRIVPFYQPIILLDSGELLGVEVLSRPRSKTMLANPDVLFKAAIQYGCYKELEMLAWKKAIQYVSNVLTNEKIFLNCNPYIIQGEDFGHIKSIFDNSRVDVSNVILEITERSKVSNYKVFFQQLQKFRVQGFQFAVDDVGGGYASLESIVETKPEIVKIDKHIISNLDNDPFKQSIVKFIVRFCKENKILSVAEGIEHKSVLDTVKQLGVDAGQGYYLYRPSPEIDLNDIKEAAKVC